MEVKWEWSQKLQGELATLYDKEFYRYLLLVKADGSYSVGKVMLKTATHLLPQNTRPRMIANGWTLDKDMAKIKAIQAFEKYTGIKVLEEEKPEEPEEEPVTVEEPVIETKEDFSEALHLEMEPISATEAVVSIIDETGLPGKIKYTTNGKPVLSNSKIYKEPFVVVIGSTVTYKKFFDDDTIEPVEKQRVI